MSEPDHDAALAHALARGRAALSDGRAAEALPHFIEAARRRPSAPEPAFASCLAMLALADPRAGTLLQDLLVRFPAHAAGWESLGTWLLQAGKAEAALVCLRRAAAIAPSAGLAIACGTALRQCGDLTGARAAFAEACRRAPKSARACFLLGLCAQDARDFAAARLAYERTLALDPGLPEAWVNLGIVLQATGDLAGAKRAYAAALARRADTFGRISQALSGAPKGELWLDLGRLRRDLAG